MTAERSLFIERCQDRIVQLFRRVTGYWDAPSFRNILVNQTHCQGISLCNGVEVCSEAVSGKQGSEYSIH